MLYIITSQKIIIFISVKIILKIELRVGKVYTQIQKLMLLSKLTQKYYKRLTSLVHVLFEKKKRL